MAKYYAVARGRSSGVYTSWNACKEQVNGYSGAKYKSFSTPQEARAWVASGGSASTDRAVSGGQGRLGGPRSSRYSGSSGINGSMSHARFAPYQTSAPNHASKGPTTSCTGSSDASSCVRNIPSTCSGLGPADVARIFTDGASRNNQSKVHRRAGLGVFFGVNDPRNVSKRVYGEQTNQRAELQAVESALETIYRELAQGKSTRYAIVSDSKYSINAVANWGAGWRAKGWKTASGGDVANRDVVERCLDLLCKVNNKYNELGLGPLIFEHVKGHSGVEGNEMADRLAVAGAAKDEQPTVTADKE